MDYKILLSFSVYFLLAVSTVTALNCISCSEYLEIVNGTVVEGQGNCRSRKEGPGVPCEKDEVCSTIFDPNTKLLTRSCDHKNKCENIPQNCTTCTTDLCGNSGFSINPLLAPIIAGLLFAALGR